MARKILRLDPRAADKKTAQRLRRRLASEGVAMLNVISAPGAGKTTLLERSLPELSRRLRLAVIEGDAALTLDARRLAERGIEVVSVTTGVSGCHISPAQVLEALGHMDLAEMDLVVVENVGNLVCPAGVDLGEDAKVAVISVAEGEDKPLKYPLLFMRSRLAIINKVDIAGAAGCDVELLERNLRSVNPGIEVIRLSARTGENVDPWLEWVERAVASKSPGGKA